MYGLEHASAYCTPLKLKLAGLGATTQASIRLQFESLLDEFMIKHSIETAALIEPHIVMMVATTVAAAHKAGCKHLAWRLRWQGHLDRTDRVPQTKNSERRAAERLARRFFHRSDTAHVRCSCRSSGAKAALTRRAHHADGVQGERAVQGAQVALGRAVSQLTTPPLGYDSRRAVEIIVPAAAAVAAVECRPSRARRNQPAGENSSKTDRPRYIWLWTAGGRDPSPSPRVRAGAGTTRGPAYAATAPPAVPFSACQLPP